MPTSSFDTTLTIDNKTAESFIEILKSEHAKIDLESDIKINPYIKETDKWHTKSDKK